MSKEVIFEALAFLDGYKASPSMKGMKNANNLQEIYIKNAVVSLVSIKQHNPKTDVGIVVNFELEEKWRKELDSANIIIWSCEYNSFRMPKSITYSLSYYKICAFKFLVENTSYEKYCFIDCDTFSVRDYAALWEECEKAFMIVPCDDTLDHPVRSEIINIYEKVFEKQTKIIHYASGFIISNRKDILILIKKCEDIYSRLMDIKASPSGGDEVIWSLALANAQLTIHSPKAYCLLSNIGLKEYWVDKADYRDTHIVMWHLPTEKRYALIWAYDYYIRTGELPKARKMAKACRIRTIYNHFTFLSIRAITKDSSVVKRNILKLFK